MAETPTTAHNHILPQLNTIFEQLLYHADQLKQRQRPYNEALEALHNVMFQSGFNPSTVPLDATLPHKPMDSLHQNPEATKRRLDNPHLSDPPASRTLREVYTELRFFRRLYPHLVEPTDRLTYVHDLDGFLRDANAAAMETYAFDPNALHTHNVLTIMAEPFRPVVKRLIEHRFKDLPRISRRILCTTDATGRSLWLDALLKRHIDEDGTPVIRGIATNISRPFERLMAYRRAVDGANDGMWDRNLETHQIDVSEQWWAMLGYPNRCSPLSLHEFQEMIHPDDRKTMQDAVAEHLNKITSQYKAEFRLRDASNGYRWIHARGRVTRDNNGRPTHISGSHTDITESKRRARFYELVLETIPTLVWVKRIEKHDEDWAQSRNPFTYVNALTAKTYGHSKDQMIGATDRDLNENEQQVLHFLKDDIAVYETKHPLQVTKETLHGRLLATTKVPIQIDDSNEGDVHVLGVATDITELCLTQEELQTKHGRLEALMELPSDDGIFFKNPDGTFIEVNRGLAELVGVDDRTTLVGKTDFDYFPKDYAEQARVEESSMFSTKEPVLSKLRETSTPDGTRWRLVSKAPILNNRNDVVQIVGISKDATFLLERTQQVALKELTHSLRDWTNAADSKVSDLRRLHPVLAKDLTFERLQRLVRRIAQMTRLAKQSIRLPGDLRFSKLDLVKVFSELVEYFPNAVFLQANLSVAHVLGIPGHLETVFLQLISNALEHLPYSDGRIDIILESKKQNYVIHVVDNGSGIADAAWEDATSNCFDYTRVRLGLTYVSDVIARHNGILDRSRTSQGTHIIVEIPQYHEVP